jgi:hypothetical protein
MDDDFEDVEDGTLDPDEASPVTEPWDEDANEERVEEEEWEDDEDD